MIDIIIVVAAFVIVAYGVTFQVRRRRKNKRGGGGCSGCDGCAAAKECTDKKDS